MEDHTSSSHGQVTQIHILFKSNQSTIETMLDLLDLYTHHRGSTAVGPEHALEQFINVRITLNQEASTQEFPRFTETPFKNAKPNGVKATNGATKHKNKKSVLSPRDDPIQSIRSPQEVVPVNGTPSNGKPGLRDGTVRFMLDPERVRYEKHAVAEFFKEEEEEYEVEVERERRRV